MEIQIRNCSEEDLIQVTEIENVSFDDPYPYRLFFTFLSDLPRGFRVATADTTQLIGYCILSHSNQRGALMISSIAVHPTFRKHGVGFKLLEDAIRIARELSALIAVERIALQVAEGNTAAQSLYVKFGFRPVRKIRNYYGRGKNGIQMELVLTGG